MVPNSSPQASPSGELLFEVERKTKEQIMCLVMFWLCTGEGAPLGHILHPSEHFEAAFCILVNTLRPHSAS
jgi:hypothetical protein